MPNSLTLHITKGELRALRFGRIFLLVTAPVAFLLGSLSLAFKPLEPKPWLEFCVALGIALLLYAVVAFVLLWAQYRPTRKKPAPNRVLSPEENSDTSRPDWDTVLAFVVKLFAGLLLLGALGIALFVSGVAAPPQVAPFWFDFGRLMGTGLLVSLGFFAAGNLVGFLFGLPRSPRPTSPPVPAATPSSSANATGSTPSRLSETEDAAVAAAKNATPNLVPASITGGIANSSIIPSENTNLEEISDWLTKIIVGVGLVELKQAPAGLKRLADFFSTTCGNEFCGALFLMMGAFFFITGFIASYILARVYLKLAIALTGQLLEPDVKRLVRETAEKTARQTADAAITKAGPVRALALISEARSTVDTAGSGDTQLDKAISLLDEALQSNPSKDLSAYALVEKARAIKRKALQKEGTDRETLLRHALDLLVQARQLIPDYPSAIYNTACYNALLGLPLSDIRDDLLTAFKLAPDLREAAAKDPDFGDLRNTPKFRALVKPAEVTKQQSDLVSRPDVTAGDLDSSIREIDLVLDAGPDQKTRAAALVAKADALRKKVTLVAVNVPGERDELLIQARTLLVEAQEADPQNALVPYLSAKLKSLRAGNLASVIEDLKKAFELDPKLKAQALTDDFPTDVKESAEFQTLIRA